MLGSATCLKAEYFSAHFVSTASKLGYVFTGWSLTVDQIKSKIANKEKLVVVTPLYTKASIMAKITVVGGAIVGKGTSADVAIMDKITLKADTAPSGKKFVGWKNSDGIYVSESQLLDVVVAADETFTAVFTDSASSVRADVGISLKITDEADGTYRLWSSHFVPKTCSVISYGFIYLENGNVAEQYMTLDLAAERNLAVAEYTRSEKNGILTCTIDTESVCTRAFMVYVDDVGNTQTVYSAVVTK